MSLNLSQLPIYPVPESEVVLVETPSELEKQISVARRALTGTYEDAHARVQAVVSRWIGVEQAVESASLAFLIRCTYKLSFSPKAG